MHYIYPGRFQPFHNDHLKVIDTFMNENPDTLLILAVVRNFDKKEKKDAFDILSEDNFLPERNPFSTNDVLRMVSAVARRRYPGRLVTTLLPRPSCGIAWEVIKSMFSEERIWIVPKREEDWDESKSNFFSTVGDKVLRIPSQRKINGKIIREYLSTNNTVAIKEAVPIEVWSIIEECI